MENKFTDQTGFEKFLENEGFEIEGVYKSNYYNTYDHCQIFYKKENKIIGFGLIDHPIRVGIVYPMVVKEILEGLIFYDRKYTYLPESNNYREYLNKLTNDNSNRSTI